MSGPPLCPQCRRKLRPGSGLVVGAWYCDHCRSAFTQAQALAAIRCPVCGCPSVEVVIEGDGGRKPALCPRCCK